MILRYINSIFTFTFTYACVADQNGFTALHLASQDGHVEMAGLLLERGADVNWMAKNGLTSLHLTAQEDAVPVADILVKNAAQIDPKTKVKISVHLCIGWSKTQAMHAWHIMNVVLFSNPLRSKTTVKWET